jgi:uncharacterized membrane protein YhaH (DUF805 family)
MWKEQMIVIAYIILVVMLVGVAMLTQSIQVEQLIASVVVLGVFVMVLALVVERYTIK